MLTKTRQGQQQGVLLERSPPATDSRCLAHQVIWPQPPEYDIVVGDMILLYKRYRKILTSSHGIMGQGRPILKDEGFWLNTNFLDQVTWPTLPGEILVVHEFLLFMDYGVFHLSDGHEIFLFTFSCRFSSSSSFFCQATLAITCTSVTCYWYVGRGNLWYAGQMMWTYV